MKTPTTVQPFVKCMQARIHGSTHGECSASCTYWLVNSATSEELLDGRHREGLHHRPCRPRLHDLHLAEDLLLAGFCCRLITQLDPLSHRSERILKSYRHRS